MPPPTRTSAMLWAGRESRGGHRRIPHSDPARPQNAQMPTIYLPTFCGRWGSSTRPSVNSAPAMPAPARLRRGPLQFRRLTEKTGRLRRGAGDVPKGARAGSQRPGWRYPSAQWVARPSPRWPSRIGFQRYSGGSTNLEDDSERLSFGPMDVYDQQAIRRRGSALVRCARDRPEAAADARTRHAPQRRMCRGDGGRGHG